MQIHVVHDILVTKTVHSPAIQKWQSNTLLPENLSGMT